MNFHNPCYRAKYFLAHDFHRMIYIKHKLRSHIRSSRLIITINTLDIGNSSSLTRGVAPLETASLIALLTESAALILTTGPILTAGSKGDPNT
jgi:hypothetical protein